jgi:hypothetical protein
LCEKDVQRENNINSGHGWLTIMTPTASVTATPGYFLHQNATCVFVLDTNMQEKEKFTL